MKRAKKPSPKIYLRPGALEALGRAVALAKSPPGKDPLAKAIRGLKGRAVQAESRASRAEKALAARAQERKKLSVPYVFDEDALSVHRTRTGKTYKLHGVAYGLMETLFGRWKSGHGPLRTVSLTPDGTKGIYDAFMRPRRGDGKKARVDLLRIEGGRIELRVP